MYKVVKKPLSANIVWDAAKNAPLGVFRDGVFLTEDKDVAEKFEALGYTVEEFEKTTETDEKTDEKADGTDEKAGKKNAAGKK